MKSSMFNKGNASSIVKGVGIAMAVGGGAAIVGSTMMSSSKSGTIKKSVSKMIKSMENFVDNM